MENTQQTVDKFAKAIDYFHSAKEEGDMDLIAKVRELLIAAGKQQEVQAFFDNQAYIREAIGKPSDVQRYLLNRYWHFQFLHCSVPSIEARSALMPNGDVRNWLFAFENKLIPFIVTNNLPVDIGNG